MSALNKLSNVQTNVGANGYTYLDMVETKGTLFVS